MDENKVVFSVELEDLTSVLPKAQKLIKVLQKNSTVKLDVDFDHLYRMMEKASANIQKQSIRIMPNGSAKAITEVNDELGRTVKLMQNLNNGEMTMTFGSSKDNSIYEARMKLLKEEYDYKMKLIGAEGEYKKVCQERLQAVQQEQQYISQGKQNLTVEQENSLIRQQIDLRNKLTEAKAKYTDKVNNQAVAEQEKEVQAGVKLLEQKAKEDEATTRLIAKEKEKLNIALRNVEISKQGLYSKANASRISTGIENLSGNNVKEVQDKVTKLRNEITKLNQDARMNGLQMGQQNVMSLGQAFVQTANKLGIFMSAAMAMRQITQIFKDNIEYVKYLNEAYTDLAMTMDISVGEFNRLNSTLQGIGKELGTSSQTIMDIGRVYANNKATLGEIIEKVEPATMFSNVSGMEGEQVTKVLQTINNQFQLTKSGAYEAGDAIEHIGDVMVKASQNMEYDFKAGIHELNEAIKTSGSVAYESGMSLEQYTSIMGALIESTGKNGAELGNFFKFVSARVTQIKSVSDEMGVTQAEMAKAEKALAENGIAIRDGEKGMRSLYDIIQDLGSIWGTLGEQERSYIAEAVAGNRQRATFLSLMSSMTEQQNLYNQVSNSSNTLMGAQEKYANSLEGQLGTLTSTYQVLLSNMMNEEPIRGAISALTSLAEGANKLVTTFGFVPTVISSVITAIVMFNQNARNMVSNFLNVTPVVGKMTGVLNSLQLKLVATNKTLQAEKSFWMPFVTSLRATGESTMALEANMLALNGKILLTKVGMIGLKVATMALQATLTMGLSLVITTLISKLMEFTDNLIHYKENLREANEETANFVKQNSESLVTAKETYSQMQVLQKELSQTDDLNKRNELQSRLNELQLQMAETLPDTAVGLDAEGQAIANNNALIEDQIRLLEESNKVKAMEFFEKNNISETLNEIDRVREKYELMKQASNQGLNSYKQSITQIDKYSGQKTTSELEFTFDATDMKEANEESLALNKTLAETKIMIDSLRNAGVSDYDISSMLGMNVSDLEDYINKLSQARPQQEGMTGAVRDMSSALTDLSNKLKEAGDEFSNLGNKASLIKTALDEYSQYGNLTESTMGKILSNGDVDMIAALADRNAFEEKYQQLLKQTTQEQQKVKEDAINMANEELNARVNTENQKAQATQESANARANAEANATNNNSKNYNIDVNNKANAEVNKANNAWANASSIMNAYGQVTNSNSSAYATDEANFANSQSAKVATAQQAASKIAYLMAQAVSGIGNKISAVGGAVGSAFANVKAQLGANSSGIGTVGTQVGTKSNQVGYTPAYKSGSGSGSGGSGSKGSSASSAKKTAKDMTDRYWKLNNAVAKYENQLDMIDEKLDNFSLTGRDEVKLLKEKEVAYKNLQKAVKNLENEYKKEANELKSAISKVGGKFDKDGMLINYNDIAKAQKKLADSKGTDSAIESYDKLIDKMERYNNLVTKEIPEQQKLWQDYANTIKDVVVEYANKTIEAEKEIADAYKYYWEKKTDTLKEAVEKRREIMNSQYEEEDNTDARKKLEDELIEIQAMIDETIRSGDEQALKAFKEQYAEKQKELNELVRDQERENMDKRYDEEIDKLEKDLEEAMNPDNLNKAIEDAMKTGFINIMGDSIDLQDALNRKIYESAEGITNATMQQYELNKALESGLTAYKEYASYAKVIGDLDRVESLANKFSNNLDTQSLADAITNNNSSSTTNNFQAPLINIANMDAQNKDLQELRDNLEQVILGINQLTTG